MSTLLNRFLLASLLLPLTLHATPLPGDTLIVLDASGSMRERIHGQSRMEIARSSIRELIQSLPAETRLGLVAYSHRRNDCNDIELLIPPGKLDKAAFLKAVDAIKPSGPTPLSAAIQFAAETLGYTTNKANIVLVSDGLETCSKDPCATVRALEKAGADLTIHAVAFDLSAREGKSFECLATETGGRFLQANDAASLKDAIAMAVTESVVTNNAPAPEILGGATIKAPAEVVAGSRFEVQWTGPGNNGDYLTIVPRGAPENSYGNSTYTRQGSPLKLTAPVEPGDSEVRYVTARSHTILARAAVKVIEAKATLSAAEQAVAGSAVQVAWTGPGNAGDYITIVEKGAKDGDYGHYMNTAAGSPVKVTAPMETGECEIRYMTGQGGKVLGRRAIKILPAEATLSAADETIAGAHVEINWTGPNNGGDYLTIVPASAPDGKFARYALTREGSPLKVIAPMEPGASEIRYMTGQGARVLARRSIKVIAAKIDLKAPAKASAGSIVAIEWTGPNNSGDYITIVPQGAKDEVYLKYADTRLGSPAKVGTPAAPGPCEIRYVSGQNRKVLGRVTIEITAP